MGHPRIARRGITWKTSTRERWDPDRLFDCCHELWPHVGSERPCVYHVVRFSLASCILIRISVTPSNMGDGLIAVFKHSNGTSLCCMLTIRMTLTTLLS
jgi:hypothetical protein